MTTLENTLLDKTMSKQCWTKVEIIWRWWKLCQTKNYVQRKFCPQSLASSGCFTVLWDCSI